MIPATLAARNTIKKMMKDPSMHLENEFVMPHYRVNFVIKVSHLFLHAAPQHPKKVKRKRNPNNEIAETMRMK